LIYRSPAAQGRSEGKHNFIRRIPCIRNREKWIYFSGSAGGRPAWAPAILVGVGKGQFRPALGGKK